MYIITINDNVSIRNRTEITRVEILGAIHYTIETIREGTQLPSQIRKSGQTRKQTNKKVLR